MEDLAVNGWPQPLPPRRPTVRVGVAVHDDRFFSPVRRELEEAGCVVRSDVWGGHRTHHVPLSRSVADWADVLVAEWCLGNAVWHAAHRRPDTRLIVRFHRFELDTPFPSELDVEAVDRVVFVGPHIREEAIRRFGWPRERCLVIPNAVDTAAFDLPKVDDARFTLGLLTWHRRLKRLDIALDVLEGLRAVDSRFRLRVKGERPENVDHVWKYDDERSYFREQYGRIARSPHLRNGVIFDPPGDDVPTWFTSIGHALSFSDVESFHLALAEGMASRAAPVIRRRPGAADLFDEAWLVDTADDAINAVASSIDGDGWVATGEAARRMVHSRYDAANVLPAWRTLVSAQPLDRRAPAAGESS